MKKNEQLESVKDEIFQELPDETMKVVFGGLVGPTLIIWKTTDHGGDTGTEPD